MKRQKQKLLTGLTGEYFVTGILCRKGYYASLTLKNYPDTDIFVKNSDNNKEMSIQVKTKALKKFSDKNEFFLPKKIDSLNNIFVFVLLLENGDTRYYIAHSKDIAKISSERKKEYIDNNPQVDKDKQLTMISLYDLQFYENKWDIIENELQ